MSLRLPYLICSMNQVMSNKKNHKISVREFSRVLNASTENYSMELLDYSLSHFREPKNKELQALSKDYLVVSSVFQSFHSGPSSNLLSAFLKELLQRSIALITLESLQS